MKTVFFANIDGFDIVMGIGDAVIDPMATSKIIDEPFQASDEVKALKTLNAQLDEVNKQASNLPPTPENMTWYQKSTDDLKAQFGPVSDAIAVKRSALMAQYAVWCQPGGQENLVTDDQAEKYQSLAKDGYKVKLDGTLVADNRNAVYWTKLSSGWTQTVITNLGDTVPAGSVLDSALTDDQRTQIQAQFEAARVAALTPDQKAAEAANAQQAAKAAVAAVQSEVAAGVSTQDALTSAVATYKTALNQINAKYGVQLA